MRHDDLCHEEDEIELFRFFLSLIHYIYIYIYICMCVFKTAGAINVPIYIRDLGRAAISAISPPRKGQGLQLYNYNAERRPSTSTFYILRATAGT